MAARLFVQPQEAERPLDMNKAKSKASFHALSRAKSMRENARVGPSTQLHCVPTDGPDVKPRKKHNEHLSELPWDALADKREQRRVLNLRGLPSKLCTAEALHTWFRAEGLGDTVEDLKVIRGKAGRLGCAVVRARKAADVERLARLFRGCRFGAGSPIASHAVAPGGGPRGSTLIGTPPATARNSVDTTQQPASPCLIPGSVALVQSLPEVAVIGSNLGKIHQDRRPLAGNILEVGQFRPPPGLEEMAPAVRGNLIGNPASF
jgi:hypothetical protein